MYSPAFQSSSVEVAKERFPRSEHELLSGLFPCEPDPGPLEAYRARAAERAAQAHTKPEQVGTWTVQTEHTMWSFGPQSLADGTVQVHSPDGWITCLRPGPFP